MVGWFSVVLSYSILVSVGLQYWFLFIHLPPSILLCLSCSLPHPPPLLHACACLFLSVCLLVGWDTADNQQPPSGHELLEGCSLDTCSSVRLDYHSFVHALPMPDFKRELHVSVFPRVTSSNPSGWS